MASLTLRSVHKQLGANTILRGIDLAVRDGEFTVLVGPSGCGKSTLLRTVAGLEEPDSGEVRIGERDVTREPPRARDVGMVFQSYALYPHLTVRDNIGFGLSLRGEKPSVIRERVDEVAQMLSLAHLLDRYPKDMSGGQRQRVAMARAIARRPQLFLFDEPLSNLDAALRAEVRVEIKKLHARLGATMLYVTHDQVEAMTLADRLVVLNAGRVEQQGAPLDVYRRPVSRFVAGFLGSPAMNFLSATVSEDRKAAVCDGARVPLDPARFEVPAAGSKVTVGLRPHDVSRVQGAPNTAELSMHVDVVEAMGFEAYAYGSLGKTPFVARLEGERLPASNSALPLSASSEAVHLFDAETGRTLSRSAETNP